MPVDFLDIDKFMIAAVSFFRIGGILFMIPIFGDSVVPVRVRVFLTIAVSLTIVPLLGDSWGSGFEYEILPISLIIMKELILGLLIGFLAKVAFEGMLLASGMVAYQMGFGTSNLIAPGSDTQMDSFSAMHRVVVILVFLSLNLHHVFFSAMVETFKLIPAGGVTLDVGLGQHLITSTGKIFSIGVQLSAPVVVALLFATAGLGLIARTVPQMNVFAMSFPVNFFVGIIIYIASTPFFPDWMTAKHLDATADIFISIKGMMPY